MSEASDFQQSFKSPQALASDVVSALQTSDERSRERMLAGLRLLPLPGSDDYQMAGSQPIAFTKESLNPQSNKLRKELHALKDPYFYGGESYKGAVDKELEEVQTQVNQGVFAKGFKLGTIEDADRLDVTNLHGDLGHQSLHIDLESGQIYDESGTNYVAENKNGKISFARTQPVTVKSENGIAKTFNENNSLFRVTLPDGSTLTKTGLFDFSMRNKNGDLVGNADDLVFDPNTISFSRGNLLTAVDGSRLVEEDYQTGQIRSKLAVAPGSPSVMSDSEQEARDRAVLARAEQSRKPAW